MTTRTPVSAGKLALRRLLAALAAGVTLAALTGVPLSAAAAQSHAATAPGRRSGSHSALALTATALFAEVHRAYLHAPAVELSVIPRESTLGFPRRFVLILRSGRVVAEEFTRSGRGGTTLVARSFRHTYARTAGATCWRRLPSSSPQTLADVGVPFPYTRTALGIGDKALPPKRTAFGWREVTDTLVEYWFLALQPRRPAHLLGPRHLPIKRFISYAVDARSHLLRSLFIEQPAHKPENTWLHATLKVTTLTTAPRLPTPTPAC